MSRENQGRGGDWPGRGRNNNYRGRGFGGSGGGGGSQRIVGGRSVVYNLGPQRDIEGELLGAVISEFQVNCTQLRTITDIYEQVKLRPHLHNHIYGNIESLKKFISEYKDNFLILPDNETVRWLTEQRLVSKNDRKEHSRKIRRDYDKQCEEVKYDLVHEENVLSFITALFLTTGESWLRLEMVERAVKQAFFHSEADLLDYAANNVRNFLIRRDHMFLEHMDQVQFYGVTDYNVVYNLNKYIRDSYQGNQRETVRRLHEYYLNEIDEDVRNELLMDDRKSFCDFLIRCKFVFDYRVNDTHVGSKLDIPLLTFNKERMMKEFIDVVDVFDKMHKKYEKPEDENPVMFDFDESDEVPGFSGGKARKGNVKKRTGAKSSISSEQASSVSAISDNPFEQRRAAAAAASAPTAGRNQNEQASSAGIRETAANRPPRASNPFLRTPGTPVAN